VEQIIYTLTERTEKTWKSEAFAFITGFSPLEKGTKKSGDNSDWKVILSSEWAV
jgi:hypothetical protein